MEREEFELYKRICEEYDGKLIEEENCISFVANNKIASYYQSGRVHTEKVVECRLRLVAYEDGRISFQGEEATHSIIGGFGGLDFDEQIFRRYLKRYNFKPKGEKQMSLFDLV